MTKSKLIILISSIAAAIVIAVTVILVVVLNSKPKPTNNEGDLGEARTIKIVQLEGTATLYDGTETIDCYKGMNLYDGDHIDVNDNSVLVARFDEDKYVYFGENTSINIKSTGKDKYKTNIFVEKGKVLAELINKLGEDEEFFLSSNNSVMAVRGTTFGVQVKDNGNEYEISYSVYKGVTELYAFDKKDGQIVSGKLVGLNNKKIELKVPKDSLLTNTEFSQKLEQWLDDIDTQFEDETDANQELDEVEVVVTVPSKEDYEDVMEQISDTTISYSPIEYNAKSYYGKYDGQDHQIVIDVTTPNSKIQYKTDENAEYGDENPTFKNPGSYRVYFKITSEGFESKEDYAIVNIEKGDIDVEYKENITVSGLIAGMDINKALAEINLFDYINLKGAEADNSTILESTFIGNDNLLNGTNSYKVNVILPDSIKELYNDVSLEISLTASEVVLDSSDVISNGQLNIDDITLFNKYNGVAEEELFRNATFKVGNVLVDDTAYESVEFTYDYKTLGYYELKEGKNEVDVKISFEDYEINTTVYFEYYDYRYSSSIDFYIDEFSVSELAKDFYYFNTNDLNVENNNYQISGSYLEEHFGFDSAIYINLPTDVLDENSDEYLPGNHIYSFPVDEISNIELLYYPNSSTRGTIRIISVYFSMTAPTGVPTYEIKPSLAYYPGTNLDFVITESKVLYSLDNENYQEELAIDELGEYNIYFKVGEAISIKGTETVLITTGTIESDGLDLINELIPIISNDGRTLKYNYSQDSEYSTVKDITSQDGSTISPTEDIYEIYTNIIKNAEYYNSVTKEPLEVEVIVSEQQGNNPGFEYEVISEGYVSLKGSVEFEFVHEYNDTTSGKETMPVIEGAAYDIILNVINPTDKNVNLSDVDTVYASRIVYSIESMTDDYEILYSLDEGKTWTDETPLFNAVGEYKIYSIYRCYYYDEDYMRSEDFVIISIQNITITE